MRELKQDHSSHGATGHVFSATRRSVPCCPVAGAGSPALAIPSVAQPSAHQGLCPSAFVHTQCRGNCRGTPLQTCLALHMPVTARFAAARGTSALALSSLDPRTGSLISLWRHPCGTCNNLPLQASSRAVLLQSTSACPVMHLTRAVHGVTKASWYDLVRLTYSGKRRSG